MIDPETLREIANLRDYFQRELECYRELTNQRDETRLQALQIALATNDKRLDTMNEFRQALSDQSGRMITRQESETNINSVTDRIEQNRISVDSRFETITRPKWTLMASLFSIFLVVVGGAWVLTGLKVDAAVSPVGLLTEQIKIQANLDTERLRILETSTAGSSQADATSKTDRSQLNERLRLVEAQVATSSGERQSQYAVMAAKLVEIETQFCASDIVRNLMHAQDMRITSLMWSKQNPGQKMPTDNAYYPRICNRTSSSEQSGQ